MRPRIIMHHHHLVISKRAFSMTQMRQAVVFLYIRRAQDDDVIDRVGQTLDLHHVSCMTRLASNNDSIIWCLGHKIMLSSCCEFGTESTGFYRHMGRTLFDTTGVHALRIRIATWRTLFNTARMHALNAIRTHALNAIRTHALNAIRTHALNAIRTHASLTRLVRWYF